ncbi:MAG: protoheme IX farnesyltransferase [Chloroflexi bacterium]|nr:protoheme IX farnesyltransferase [Chloroflexota bacterium]
MMLSKIVNALDYFKPLSRFRKLTLFTALLTYALVVLGGVVRVTGSGLGCPDWPLCYGQPLPPASTEAVIEMAHRYVAGVVTILVGLIAWTAWRAYRREKWIVQPALWGLGVIGVQVVLGAITVILKNHPITVVAHFFAALTMLACATMVAVAVRLKPDRVVATDERRRLVKWVLISLAAVIALLFVGAIVTATNSALGCLFDWPLCRGALIPNSTEVGTYIQWFHRLVALITGAILTYTTVLAWRLRDQFHAVWVAAGLALSFFSVQAVIGGTVVLSRIHLVLRGAHLAMAAAVWTATVVMVVLAARVGQAQTIESEAPADRAAPKPALSLKSTIGAYVRLTKPWIIVLLLVTTFAAMLIAQRGLPALPLVVFTLVGGALSASSANAINCYIDRDIDVIMNRTKNRPTSTGRIDADHALAFGLITGVASFVVLALGVNLLAAILATIGLLYYVFIYTGYLKRSTMHNVVIGGVAGAIPPMVGYAAVTGQIDALALFMFLIIFYWSPPHTWALALIIRSDYERAGVPMLPVVVGERETRRQIVLYTLQLVAITLVIFALQMMGWIYFVAALVLNGVFLWRAIKLARLPETDKALARRLYKYSQSYLALLFLAMVIDKIVVF